ncbi:phage tail family protein [Halalkalibacterium halodurans]|uniref:distal tail protein Dit n=1 Tax=Halalkalibacterium halodurans TaxID=86665 RepID=UPI002E1CFA95|nr:distal tail protein Dit [Halalkalibacterium halodurans]MED4172557.1 phage tail family protein [Halalkalibacterium halodurans]
MSFRDFGEGGEVIRPSLQTIFNNVNLDEELTDNDGSFTTISVSGRALAQTQTTLLNPTHKHGGFYQQSRLEPRIITVRYKISAKTNEKFRQMFNRLNRILAEEEKRIEFTDENAFFVGSYYEAEDFDENSNVIVSSFSFICADPYKYDKVVYQATFQDDVAVVPNDGTAECEPIFELTAKEKATFAVISNGAEEYNLIGTPSDDDVVVVDEKTSVLYENGSTINTWITPVTLDVVDSNHIDHIDGVMGTDGAGIRPETWGTVGQKQRGAGALKELSQPIQDFEIETTFDIISRREEENWRMGIMLFDEFMNNIGMIGLKDDSRHYKRRTPLARIGPYRGGGPSNGYLIGDADRFDNARDTTLFYLRFRREGKTFNVYIGEWMSQRHVRQWTGTYHDVANEYMGRLKYISLYITSYQDRVRPSRLRMNSVEVFELTKATVDQTPYIIYPGDVITFDHSTADILLNGESRKDLKDFGGSFFKLKKGLNTLTVTPENTFNAKVTYRERYR